MSCFKWFVLFNDCYTRMSWIYMMKYKCNVFQCFQDFHMMVATQFDAKIWILRTDNGTEYINKEFAAYLSEEGILH